MIDTTTLKNAWALLDRRERRNAWIVLAVVSIAALGAAFMIGSVFPFLTVLSDTSSIEEVPQLAWAYEKFGFESRYAFLVALGLATLAVIVVSNALQLARIYVISRYSEMRVHSLSLKLLARYLGQPYEFFLDRHSSDMSTRVLSEVEQTVNSFYRPITEVVASVLTIVAIVVLLIMVNPVVAVGAFVVFGSIYGTLFVLVRTHVAELGNRRTRANRERFLTAKEVLGGIKEVKLHGHENAYIDRFRRSSFNTMHARLMALVISQSPQFVVQALALGGVIVLCLLLLDRAEFEAGGSALRELIPVLGVIAFAGQRMMPELSKLYSNLTRMKFGTASLESLWADMDGPRSPESVPGRQADPLPLKQELRLDDVSYRYPNAQKDSVDGVSLTIRAGERIGIVGGTGAGKTTVADIVLGLLAPSKGSISADGVVIGEDNRRLWQRNVGYVPQEIFLVDATVAENIAFGVPAKKIDRDRVEKAARIAQLHDFVRNEMPEGYATRVGERGVRLSGGQRQRIGIARALYRGSDLIVFDEATSALDNVTEREAMAAIDAIPGHKTILMIAHRLTTVKNCDKIVVLDKGRIEGVGPWSELIEQNAAFRRIAEAA